MCKKMSSDSCGSSSVSVSSSSNSHNTAHVEVAMDDHLFRLQEKLHRTTKILQEIQKLTPVCEEARPEDVKEKQIFSRRILQLSAELQDARDAILTLCQPPRLTRRQFELVTSDEAIDDPANDPSVRFFGLDWKQVFSKCFNVSLNVQIFRTQVLDRDIDLDLVLISAILKDLASVEVDAMSHGEAVLNGRLSKSQQQLIQHEQTKFNDDVVATNKSSKLSKSKSFKDTNGQRRQQQQAQAQQRQISRYKKNKTTDLNKLASSSSIHSGMSLSSSTTVANKKNEWQEVMGETPPRRKSSFMQNVSSIFKNIR